jgi:hypothetical protein
MATLLKNSITQNIGINPTEVLYTAGNNRYTVIGLNLSNTGNSVVQVSIMLKSYEPLPNGDNDPDNMISSGYYLKNIMVAPQSSLKAITNSEKLVLATNNSLLISANANNSIDAIISYVEIL